MLKIRFATLFISALFLSSVSLCSLISVTTVQAQETSAEQTESDPQQASLDSIEAQKRILKDLDARIGKSEGFTRTAYELRYEKSLKKLLELNLNFAEGVANLDQAKASEKYRPQAIQILNSQFALTANAIKRFRKQIVLPEAGKSAAEQAAAQRASRADNPTQVDRVIRSLHDDGSKGCMVGACGPVFSR